MKILHTIGSLSKGGAEKQCRLLIDHHAEIGHEIGVLYFYDNHDIIKNPKVKYYQINRGNRLGILQLFLQIRIIICEFKPDIIHNWLPEIITIPATIISKYYRIPSISSQRRVLQRNKDFFDRIRDFFILINHLIADKVICNFDFSIESKFTKKIIELKGGRYIQNGFELDSPMEKNDFSFLENKAIKLLFVGRLVVQKNIDLLLKSVQYLKSSGYKVQLVIFGEGKLEKELKDFSFQLGLNKDEVHFAGYIQNWHDYVCNFDLFVFPTNAEGMPNVLIEAMNSKIATIANNIPEISSIFNHSEDIHLVKNINYHNLAESIEYVHLNSGYKSSLIRNAYNRVKEFTVECMANKFLDSYHDLIKSKINHS